MRQNRLQLVWPNKDKKLLTQGVDTYEWVDPQDWRATEVRLFEPVKDVGDPAAGNLVIHGDALHALTSLTQLPDLRAEYLGKVKLCYIDPPFNTGQAFTHYNDAVEHSVWLTMMRDRLVQIRQLLSDDGSVWVHLDDAEVHRMRSVMDEVMGAENFVATVIWQKKTSRENRKSFSTTHDYILVYSKRQGWRDVRNRLEDFGAYANPDNDPRGPWRSVPMTAQAGNGTKDQFYTVTTPTGAKHDPPEGRCWTYTERRLKELDAAGRVYWPRKGAGKPRLKMYPEDAKGLVPFTIWPASETGDNPEAVKELRALSGPSGDFDTPKPERLMQRVIHVATNPGDLVLDCFAGSGTTAAVAMKMGRRFVTTEVLDDTLSTFVVPRLTRVVEGTDTGGVSHSVTEVPTQELPEDVEVADIKRAAATIKTLSDAGELDETLDPKTVASLLRALRTASKTTEVPSGTGWTGGSGFRLLRVAESMFVSDEDGDLYLANWLRDEDLDRAVCAQMRYAYEPSGPFAGRKGRSRLAVLDAMATEGAIRLLVDALEDGETVLVVAQAIADGVEPLLQELRKGSQVRKMPNDLARAGVLPSQVVRIVGGTDGEVA